MRLKTTIDGTDYSNLIDTKDYSIETNIGGQLDNFNTANIILKLGPPPVTALTVFGDLLWKSVVIEDLSLPLPISDTFTRANGVFSGSNLLPDTGVAWAAYPETSGDITIDSNHLKMQRVSRATQDTQATNCTINAEFVSGSCPALLFRHDNVIGTSGYVLYNLDGFTHLCANPGPVSQHIVDSFNRADYTFPAGAYDVVPNGGTGTASMSPDIGLNYLLAYYSSLEIASNQLKGQCFYIYQNMSSADYVMTGTWVSGVGNGMQFRGVYGGSLASDAGYILWQTNSSIRLEYADGSGTIHEVAGAVTTHSIYISCIGDTISILIDGGAFHTIVGSTLNVTTGINVGWVDWACAGNDCIIEDIGVIASVPPDLGLATGAGANDRFSIALNSSNITIARNGTTIFSIDETAYAQSTNVSFESGFLGYTGYHVYDDFSVSYPTASASRHIFSGYCDNVELTVLNGITLGAKMSCKDSSIILKERLTYKTYLNKTDKYIIQDLLTTYFGTLFDVTSAIDTTSAPMEYFATYYETVLVAIQRICKINGARFWIDYDNKAHYTNSTSGVLAPFGFSESGNPDSVSPSRTMGVNRYLHDLSALATKVVVIGGSENRTFTAESITTNPHDLLTLTPTVSQFKYAAYNYPVFWTYKNSDNANSTVDHLAIDSTNTAVANHMMLLQEWRLSNGFGGFHYAQTYSDVYMQAGEMVICVQTPTGFETQKYNFEEDIGYGVTVDYQGHATVYRTASSGFGKGICNIIIQAIYALVAETYFYDAPRLLWIGHGWPSVVNQATGTVEYTTATVDTSMLIGSTPGSPGPWTAGLTLPTVPSVAADGSYPHSISYSGPVPIKAIATMDNLRDVYGPVYDGSNHLYFDLLVKDEKIKSAQIAVDRALMTLVERARGIKSLEINSMNARGLQPGMVINVDSPSRVGAAENFLVNKVTINGLGGSEANYKIYMGDYNPQMEDLYLVLSRQKDDSQEGEDARTTVTYTQDYTTTATYYYDDPGTVWDDFTWA